MNKVLNTIGGLSLFAGFLLMLGVVGRSDYAVEIGEYLPWYYGWQYLLLGVAIFGLGTVLMILTENEDD